MGIALLLIVLQFSVVHNAKHRNAFLQPGFSRHKRRTRYGQEDGKRVLCSSFLEIEKCKVFFFITINRTKLRIEEKIDVVIGK
jgi:hypothetical protein